MEIPKNAIEKDENPIWLAKKMTNKPVAGSFLLQPSGPISNKCKVKCKIP